MKCSCGKETDNPSGRCSDCLDLAAKNFWEFVESYREKRIEISKN